jgi:hypothetical protein
MKRKIIIIPGLVRQCGKKSCDFQQKLQSQKQLRNTSLEHPGVHGKIITGALVGKLQRRRPLGGLYADGMILKWRKTAKQTSLTLK